MHLCDEMSWLFFIRARKNVRPHIGDIDAAAVPCGFGRAIGNKVRYIHNSYLLSI